jgi:hypothetical protein
MYNTLKARGLFMNKIQSSLSVRRIYCPVLVLLLFATAPLSFADEAISLRIVDARTGKPIRKVSATLIKWSKDGQVEQLSTATTNTAGLAVFHLAIPLPDRIGFDFVPDELKYCSDLAFSTKEILNAGVLGQNKCQSVGPKLSFGRKAGEITLFAKKVSLSERMRRELP